MKKLSFVFGVIIILIMSVNAYGQIYKYMNTYSWTKGCDTTSLKSARTDSLWGGTTGFPIFYTNMISDASNGLPSSVSGLLSVYITSLDTDATGDGPDTSKDSSIWTLYTAFVDPWASSGASGYRTAEKALFVCTVANAGVGTSKVQNVSFKVKDSVLGEVLYWRVQSKIQDSDNSIARYPAYIHYTASITMYAR